MQKALIPGHSICITVGFGGFSFNFTRDRGPPNLPRNSFDFAALETLFFFRSISSSLFPLLPPVLFFPCCVMFLILRFSFANVIARLLEAWLGFFVIPPLTGDEATRFRSESDGLLVLCGP